MYNDSIWKSYKQKPEGERRVMHFVFNVVVVFFLTLNRWLIFSNDYNFNVTAVTRFEVFHSGESML